MITGFDHIQIYCGDAEKAVAFFRDIFGGKEISGREKRDTPFIRMDVQGVVFALNGSPAGQWTA